jgi:hypothetical protein
MMDNNHMRYSYVCTVIVLICHSNECEHADNVNAEYTVCIGRTDGSIVVGISDFGLIQYWPCDRVLRW